MEIYMVCSKCEAQIANSTDTFCSVCGSPVSQKAAASGLEAERFANRPATPQKQQATPAFTATPPPRYVPIKPQVTSHGSRRRKKRILPVVIISLIAVLVAAGAIWYFLLRDNPARSSDDESTLSESADLLHGVQSDEAVTDSPFLRAVESPPPKSLSQNAIPPEPDADETDASDEPDATPSAPETVTYPPPYFSGINASGVTDSPVGRNYKPDQAIDGKPETAWNVPRGEDAWITLSSDTEQYVSGIRILNGYTKYSPEYKTWLYFRNDRPKDITIYFSDGTYISQTLPDVFDEDDYYYHDIVLDTPKLTDFIKISVESVYKGDRWDDICISEIEVY